MTETTKVKREGLARVVQAADPAHGGVGRVSMPFEDLAALLADANLAARLEFDLAAEQNKADGLRWSRDNAYSENKELTANLEDALEAAALFEGLMCRAVARRYALGCAYCDWTSRPELKMEDATVQIKEHIQECKGHPLRKLEAELAGVLAETASFVEAELERAGHESNKVIASMAADLENTQRDLEGARICRDRESADLATAKHTIAKLEVNAETGSRERMRLAEHLEASRAKRLDLGRQLSDKFAEWGDAVDLAERVMDKLERAKARIAELELATKLCPKYGWSVASELAYGNCEGCVESIRCGTFAKTTARREPQRCYHCEGSGLDPDSSCFANASACVRCKGAGKRDAPLNTLDELEKALNRIAELEGKLAKANDLIAEFEDPVSDHYRVRCAYCGYAHSSPIDIDEVRGHAWVCEKGPLGQVMAMVSDATDISISDPMALAGTVGNLGARIMDLRDSDCFDAAAANKPASPLCYQCEGSGLDPDSSCFADAGLCERCNGAGKRETATFPDRPITPVRDARFDGADKYVDAPDFRRMATAAHRALLNRLTALPKYQTTDAGGEFLASSKDPSVCWIKWSNLADAMKDYPDA